MRRLHGRGALVVIDAAGMSRPVDVPDPADRHTVMSNAAGGGTEPVVTRIDSPRAMVEAVPHLLGFVPERSAVVSFMAEQAGGMLRSFGSCRVDLPAADDVSEWIARIVEPVLERVAPAAVIVTYWLDTDADEPVRSAMAAHSSVDHAVRRSLAARGIRLLDAIAVAGGRFASLLCQDTACCGELGEAWSAVDHSVLSAELVAAGMPMPVTRRRDLDKEIARDEVEAYAFNEALDVFLAEGPAEEISTHLVDDVLGRWCDAGTEWPSPPMGRVRDFGDDLPALALALLDGLARDACVLRILRASRAELHASLPWWNLLLRSAPDDLRVVPGAMAGLTQYLLGDGARANIAIEAAYRTHVELRRRLSAVEYDGDWEGEDQVGGEGIEAVTDRAATAPSLLRIIDGLCTAGLTPDEVRQLLLSAYTQAYDAVDSDVMDVRRAPAG
jgi:hypothetical protein